MNNPAIKLQDVEVIAASHPREYVMPTPEDRYSVETGAWVKCIFSRPERGVPGGTWNERMWVQVMGRINAGGGIVYTGVLANDPFDMPGLEAGDEVSFEPRHILQIMSRDDYEAVLRRERAMRDAMATHPTIQ